MLCDKVHQDSLEVLIRDGYLIERHAVHLDGLEILLLLEVDIADVGLQAAGELEHLVLGQLVVQIERLDVVARVRVLTRHVQ